MGKLPLRFTRRGHLIGDRRARFRLGFEEATMNTLTRRPKTQLLVDGGDPEETLRVKRLIGYVDGQTTNPTLVAKTRKFGRWFHPAKSSVPGRSWMNTRRLCRQFRHWLVAPAFRSRCSLTSTPPLRICSLKDAKCFPGFRTHTSNIPAPLKGCARRKCPCVSLCAST